MATERTVQKSLATGTATTWANVDQAGDYFKNTGVELVGIWAESATSNTTVHANTSATCSYGKTTGHNINANVTASQTKFFGPFDPVRFNNATGYVNITYTGSPTWANVKIAVIATR